MELIGFIREGFMLHRECAEAIPEDSYEPWYPVYLEETVACDICDECGMPMTEEAVCLR